MVGPYLSSAWDVFPLAGQWLPLPCSPVCLRGQCFRGDMKPQGHTDLLVQDCPAHAAPLCELANGTSFRQRMPQHITQLEGEALGTFYTLRYSSIKRM